MELSGVKKHIRICSYIIPIFFHIVPEHVQAVVVMHDEMFRTLAVEKDFLLSEQFLDLGFDGVVRRKTPASKMSSFFKFNSHVKVEGNQVGSLRC
jgi:hypothetical protein